MTPHTMPDEPGDEPVFTELSPEMFEALTPEQRADFFGRQPTIGTEPADGGAS